MEFEAGGSVVGSEEVVPRQTGQVGSSLVPHGGRIGSMDDPSTNSTDFTNPTRHSSDCSVERARIRQGTAQCARVVCVCRVTSMELYIFPLYSR
mgnify:CR=1 FL=1